MSPRPKLITPRGSLQEAVRSTAWKQIAEAGASALSLRAIARELQITAPAIYNYFPSRDDLVTALIIDAYHDLGDSQLIAVETLPETDLVGRLKAAGNAYRSWAKAYPERYQLIFGKPIPGYVAPEEKTRPAAAYGMEALIYVLETLRVQGKVSGLDGQIVEPVPLAGSAPGEVDEQTLSIATLFWARMHGLVSLEISHTLLPGISADALFEHELDALIHEFIR